MRRIQRVLGVLVILASVGQSTRAQSPLRQLRDPISPDHAGVPAFGDFDGDGDRDLVLLPDGVLLNDGHGTFVASPAGPISGVAAFAACVGDLNGDFMEDVVVETWAGSPSILLAQPPGQLVLSPAPLPAALAQGAWRVALGDVDGDGDLDLFGGGTQLCFIGVGWNCPAPPFLWLNDGLGVFSDASFQLPSINVAVVGVVFSDFDGDGDQDVFIVQDVSSSIPSQPAAERFLLLNDGGGSFSLGPVAPASLSPGLTGISVADADGDGDSDLYLGSLQPELLLNDGAGNFTRPGIVSAQLLARSLLIDLDLDGIPELVRCRVGAVSVHVFDGVGAYGVAIQGFGAPGSVFGSSAVPRAAVGDVDQDGDADLYVEESNGPRLFLNDGQGGLEPSSGTLSYGLGGFSWAVGDLDADGYPDLTSWTITGLRVATNDGNGNLRHEPGASLPGPLSGLPVDGMMQLIDGDGDGDLDIYCANSVSGSALPQPDVYFRNDGGFTFTHAGVVGGGGEAHQMVRGDLDGDGDADLVQGRSSAAGPTAVGAGRQNRLVVNATVGGNVVFIPTPLPSPADHTQDLALADVDLDGDLDIVEANSGLVPGPSASRLLLNDGSAGFSLSPLLLPPATGVAAGDVDQDGDIDLFLNGQLFVGDGQGGFLAAASLPGLVSEIALDDLDGDGDLDATTLDGLGAVQVWWNGGIGLFSSGGAVAATTAWSWPRLHLADLDRDGDPDLVTAGPRIYTNTRRQIARRGLPRPGRPLDIEVFGVPGSGWILFASPHPAVLPLPPYGTVLIDPLSAVELGAGIFAPTGSSVVSFPVPNDPSIAGAQLHWQAGLALPAALTNADTTIFVAP